VVGDLPIMNMEPEAACSKTAKTARKVRRRSTGLLNISSHPMPELDSFSFSIAARIAVASARESWRAGRSHSSAFTPSSKRPWRMSHRGLSGMNHIVQMMMRGNT